MSKVKRNKTPLPKALKKQFTPKKRKKRNAKRANNQKQPAFKNIKRTVINDCLKNDLRTRLVHKYNLANTNTTSAIVTIKNNTNSNKPTSRRRPLNASSISSSSSDVVIVEDSFSEVRKQSSTAQQDVSASDVIVLDDSGIENISDSEAIVVDENNTENRSESGSFDDSVIIVSVTNSNSPPKTNKNRGRKRSNNAQTIENQPKNKTSFVRKIPETSNLARNVPVTVTNASQFGTTNYTPMLAQNSSLLCPTNVPGPVWQDPPTVAQQLQISVRNNLCPTFVSPEDANIVNNLLGSNFYNAGTVQKQGLRVIVIDGSNVAMGHSNGRYFSVEGLKICIDYFLQRGHKVKAFIPQFRMKTGQSSNPQLLQYLSKLNYVICTPSREIDGKRVTSYDDRFIVQCAAALEGVIVSCDNFKDLIAENPSLRPVIEQRLLMPTWVDDMIIFPRDPLGRRGPSLERFLRFP